MNREQIIARMREIQADLEPLTRADTVTVEDAERADALVAELDTLIEQLAEMDRADERIGAARDRLAALATSGVFASGGSGDGPANTAPDVIRRSEVEPYEVLSRRDGSVAELTRSYVDCARHVLDTQLADHPDRRDNAEAILMGRATLGSESVGRPLRLLAAENILSRATPEYESAFIKTVSNQQWSLTAEEHRAMQRAAMAVGADATGAVMVPTHLDPTVILTNAGARSGIGAAARRVTLVEGNVWNGVTSAGITAAYTNTDGGEADEADDDTPGFASASISVHRADIYAQSSLEAVQDIADLEGTLQALANDALDVLHATKWITGTGTGEPYGLVTRLDATAASEVATDTNDTLAAADIYDLKYAEIGNRFRDRGAWLMNSAILAAIRQFGTTDANFTVDMTADNTFRLLGSPVLEASAMASAVADAANIVVYGDPMEYIIVTKLGMSLTRIPVVFGTPNNRPTGEQGWFWVLRDGADTPNPAAFRLLQVA